MGEKFVRQFLPKFRLPRKFGDLLHAANLQHGTDGFTSPAKGGVLFALKIRRLRPSLNPRTWVLKASTLPLDPYTLEATRELNFTGTIFALIGHLSCYEVSSFCMDTSSVSGTLSHDE